MSKTPLCKVEEDDVLRAMLAESPCDKSVEDLEDWMRLEEDLGWDSLDTIAATMAASNVLDEDIPDNAIAEMTTIGDVREYVKKVNAKRDN